MCALRRVALSHTPHPHTSPPQKNKHNQTKTKSYYRQLYALAKRGNLRAQKEYGAMLRRLARIRRAYAEAYANEDDEALAAGG